MSFEEYLLLAANGDTNRLNPFEFRAGIKPLTGEQIEFAWMKAMQSTPGTTLPIHEFARAIEQAHGIKETP